MRHSGIGKGVSGHGRGPSGSNELLEEPAEQRGSMTGASPVTTIDERMASHLQRVVS